MISYLDNGGSLYIESVDIGTNHTGTAFFDYLGAMLIGDGEEQEVIRLKGSSSNISEKLVFYVQGGFSPHYSLDRLETNNGGELVFSSEDGQGRTILKETDTYRTISSSVLLGSLVTGDSLNMKAYLVSEMVNFFLGYNPTTSIQQSYSAIMSLGNYPNPFLTETNIEFSLAQQGLVVLNVYNLQGKLVKQLKNEEMMPGTYNVIWDATNGQGVSVDGGYYFYELITGQQSVTEKMILVR